MDFIYSRFRLPRIIGPKKIKRSNIFLIILIIIIIISYATAIYIIDLITPMLERQEKTLARGSAVKLANEAARNAMKEMKYDDLCTITKNDQGEIKIVTINVINANKICTSITNELQDKLMEKANSSFSISLGSLTGNKILISKGPKVDIKMETIGDIETNIQSEFKEAGINQTIHRIYINVICHVKILSPYKDIEEDIESQILLAESVIVGNIPSTYYNLEGLEKDNAVNLIEK